METGDNKIPEKNDDGIIHLSMKRNDSANFISIPNEIESSKEILFNKANTDNAMILMRYDNKDTFKMNKRIYSISEDMIYDWFEGNEFELYRTEDGKYFFLVIINGIIEAFMLGGKSGKLEIRYYLQKIEKLENLKSEISHIHDTLFITARKEGTLIKQEPRAFRVNDTIFYDLHNIINPKYVVINKYGYSIKQNLNMLFKTNDTQSEQPEPIPGGSLDLLDYYFNMDSDMKLLLKIYILCAFIPGFEHPIILLDGETEAGKSTLSRILKSLIDPTTTEIITMPTIRKNLIVNLDQHYFIPYDNLPVKISETISNLLCQAVTGAGTEDRKLYTDDDIISRRFQRIILLNGIDIGVLKPDLHRRILAIHLKKVERLNKKSPEHFKIKFQDDKPKILDAIFNTVSDALKLLSTINPEIIEKLTDFEKYGYVCSEAICKGEGDNFISIYRRSVEEQKQRAAEDDPFVDIIMNFMEDKTNTWIGTMTDLRYALQKLSKFPKLDYMKKIADIHPKELSRKMNTNIGLLLSQGIKVEFHKTAKQRNWHITNLNLQIVTEDGIDASDGSVPIVESKGIAIERNVKI
ncbi:MAG: hypothetical protein ACYCYI_09160 [Saccharofermentanales bacterium]